jgi:HSP20 family protein
MQPNDYFSDVDDLFERMTRDHGSVFGRRGRPGAEFAVDVAHHDDEVVVTADLPGFEQDDFEVTVDDRHLTIRADATAESGVDEDAYVGRERRQHAVARTVRLPAAVDADGAAASYRNGVLTVTLPVTTDADVRHIDVE